jgi:hypothetical protein
MDTRVITVILDDDEAEDEEEGESGPSGGEDPFTTQAVAGPSRKRSVPDAGSEGKKKQKKKSDVGSEDKGTR